MHFCFNRKAETSFMFTCYLDKFSVMYIHIKTIQGMVSSAIASHQMTEINQ